MRFSLAIIISTFLLFLTNGVHGQNELALHTNKTTTGAFNEDITISDDDINEVAPYYYRQHKKLATFFSGIAIELTTSDFPLERDYSIFAKFGNVKVDKLDKGGLSYVITGFKDKKSAKTFLRKVVIHSAPEARIISYSEGKRKVKS